MIIRLNTGDQIPGTCTQLSPHVVQLLFDGDKPELDALTGFAMHRDSGELLFDGSGYTTLYREIDGGYQLSDDGSMYVEPVPDPEPAEPDPDYTPTLEELQASKKQEIGAACEQIIYAGVDVELSSGTEHFSLTEKDQINLFGIQSKLAQGATQVEYHADGQLCKYYSAADMQTIMESAMFYVSYNTTYCNSLNVWIASVESEKELAGIYYGAEIPDAYVSVVLANYQKQLKELGNDSSEE